MNYRLLQYENTITYGLENSVLNLTGDKLSDSLMKTYESGRVTVDDDVKCELNRGTDE